MKKKGETISVNAAHINRARIFYLKRMSDLSSSASEQIRSDLAIRDFNHSTEVLTARFTRSAAFRDLRISHCGSEDKVIQSSARAHRYLYSTTIMVDLPWKK